MSAQMPTLLPLPFEESQISENRRNFSTKLAEKEGRSGGCPHHSGVCLPHSTSPAVSLTHAQDCPRITLRVHFSFGLRVRKKKASCVPSEDSKEEVQVFALWLLREPLSVPVERQLNFSVLRGRPRSLPFPPCAVSSRSCAQVKHNKRT